MSRSSSEWQAPGRIGGSTPPGVGVQRADAWVEHRRRRTPRRTVPTVRSRRGTRSSATTLAARRESCRRAEPGEAGRTGIFSLLPHVRMHVNGQGNGPDASPRPRRRSRGPVSGRQQHQPPTRDWASSPLSSSGCSEDSGSTRRPQLGRGTARGLMLGHCQPRATASPQAARCPVVCGHTRTLRRCSPREPDRSAGHEAERRAGPRRPPDRRATAAA